MLNHDETQLPATVPKPLGAYRAVVLRGRTGYVSGQFPIREGGVLLPGRLGRELSVDDGRQAARAAALNVLGQIRDAVPGGLAAIELARVDGYIACEPGFNDLAAVLDGASETFVHVLGERGAHARGVLPVSHLPNDMAVELMVVFHLHAPR